MYRDGTSSSNSSAPISDYQIKWKFRRDPKWFPMLFYLYTLTAIPYIIWRFTIINWSSWYGLVVYLAELYGFITTFLFLLMARRIQLPIHRPTKLTATVDVLIPTYTESLTVLEPVVIGAKRIQGVRKVLVLDDGNRLEIKQMAERLGVKYYPRLTNEHAKAGNLNSGLKHTDAEFIICLDADHIPVPHFLQRTLGYLDDPAVAFVQTPQTYYNTSTFLFRRRHGKRAGWSEQGMFYNCIQQAKNRWNAAFFVGTSAVLRRAAIDAVGGFATGTATEDIHTALRLHAKGWKSVYVPEPLAYGLESENLKEFYKQRRRWAAGSLGLLFRSADSPLRARGLSFMQRLNYLSATLAHLQGVQKLCFFLAPVVAILTRTPPIRGNVADFTLLFSGFILLSLLITWAYSRGTYHLLYTEAYSLANMMAHFGGIKGIFKVQKKFAVSRKSTIRRQPTWISKVLWALVALAVASLGRAFWLFTYGRDHSGSIISGFVFIAINTLVLLSFLLHLRSYETHQHLGPAPSVASQPLKMYGDITFTFDKEWTRKAVLFTE